MLGVIDSRVDFDHEDLIGREVNSNSTGIPDFHGTHVAGTIGATFDNEIGISGVAPNSRLLGYDARQLGTSFYYNAFGVAISPYLKDIAGHLRSLMLLIYVNNAPVINFSVNDGRLEGFAADRGNEAARTFFNENATIASVFLSSLLEQGNEFLIVSSAGNNNNIAYVIDDTEEFGFRMPRDSETNTVSGNVNARYNSFFNAITDREIRNRILIVGSIGEVFFAENATGFFQQSTFSNRNPDIFAPGERIFSTLPNNAYGNRWNGNWISGTSMVAPHVSGVAAMVWGANPNLRGDQVRNIILNNATSLATNNSVNVVNARLAVEYVLDIEVEMGSVSAVVVSGHTGQPLTSATVRALNARGRVVAETTTNLEGRFGFTLPVGRYTFEYSMPWYVTRTSVATITAGSIAMLLDPIVMTRTDIQPPTTTQPDNSNFAGGTGTATNPFLISTPAHLDNVRNFSIPGQLHHYRLTNDIDLASWGDWEPVPTLFGTFDGNGHVIRNMRVNDAVAIRGAGARWSAYAGLFGQIGSTHAGTGHIVNLGMIGSVINPQRVPSVIGTINEIYIGGIAGYIVNGSIVNSFNMGQVSTNSNRRTFAGGIAGFIDSGHIANSYNTGEIRVTSANNSVTVGGIAGATTWNARGGALLRDSYNTGIISATSTTAGVVAGGIVGQGSGTTRNCFNAGAVTATSGTNNVRFGGIAGTSSDLMQNSFYLNTTATTAVHGTSDNEFTNVQALTIAQMRNQASFTGWDFTNIWAINPTVNNGFPYLRGMRP